MKESRVFGTQKPDAAATKDSRVQLSPVQHSDFGARLGIICDSRATRTGVVLQSGSEKIARVVFTPQCWDDERHAIFALVVFAGFVERPTGGRGPSAAMSQQCLWKAAERPSNGVTNGLYSGDFLERA
jgi:hypothetical protein